LNDIVTGNALDIKPLSPDGLKASAMTAAQRDQLMKGARCLRRVDDRGHCRRSHGKVKKAGIENIAFAWAGSFDADRSITTACRGRRS
jgi:hypothetical protein